jgi:DNA-binding phage protein
VANVVVSALATWNGKALRKAKQDVSVFNKQLQGLARTFGVAFSATAIVAFSKKAVKAFAEDELAAKSLALQLENTGNAFRVTQVEDYIKSLEKTYAILTDLRTPFKTLLNVTGSVDLAQRSLEAALNTSAGTGENLNTVVAAISAGIRGQTKAIKNLNTGIDESIIATGDMNKIMAALEARFSGQAAARLDTYSGKMDVLKKGADEATKSIGRGLVDALTILGEDSSVAGLATDFENMGDNIAYATVEMAKLIKKFSDLVANPSFKAGLLALAIASKSPKALIAVMGIIGTSAIGGALTSARTISPEQNSALAKVRLLNARIEAKLSAAKKEEFRILNAKNAIENKNVEELKKKFDLERIGLTQALNLATDEETKLRLRAQLAILDNNEALAKKLLAELEAAEALKKLAEQARLAGMSIEEYTKSLTNKYDLMITDLIKQFKNLGLSLGESMALANMSARYQAQADAIAAGRGPSGPSGPSGAAPLSTDPYDILIRQLAPQLNTEYGLPAQDAISLATMSARYQAQADAITINIQAGGDKMSQAIAESIQIANRNGYDLTGAGQLP